jgi:hypothetical protein
MNEPHAERKSAIPVKFLSKEGMATPHLNQYTLKQEALQGTQSILQKFLPGPWPQVVECLPSKQNAMSSNPNAAKIIKMQFDPALLVTL